MLPLIGITTSRSLNERQVYYHAASEAYIHAVAEAGGMPVLIPADFASGQAAELCARLDGVLLTGGGDIDPQIFNGRPHESIYDIDLARDELEIALVQLAVQTGLPFLGICRGIQVLNVALGGTLYTDIADQLPGALKHDNYSPEHKRDYLAHTVKLAAGSRLRAITGLETIEVNSLHHQGIEQPAAVLTVTGAAPDGLIEAVELSGHPFGLGVQWHPECLPAYEAQRAIFKAFIQAAALQA